ncbi:uncharacterized protein PF3D7_1120600-like isoform X1 [Linepithema humile]|uniref:uncharacterized protein PF3D7_1120600-like isoform X1 n=1 Tax=Linepithema humile TaxID=83485 RepID=UPI00351F54CA
MKKSVQLVKKHNTRQLKLLDEITNIEYIIEVNEEDFNRAYKDITFANALLQKAKHTLLINERNSSTIDNPSSSKKNMKNINTIIQLDDLLSNIETNQNETDNNASDIDNETNMLNIESIEKWTHNAILLLISLYKEKSYMLGKESHKKMWNLISQRMKEKQYNFTVTQCYNKMDTLKRRYRQIIDHNAQSGNDKKEWIYLESLDELFCNKPWVKPISVAGSNIRESEKSVFNDNDSPKKQKKISLHEEKANYLRTSLEEKRIKREETAKYRAEKLKILKDLKEIFQTRK